LGGPVAGVSAGVYAGGSSKKKRKHPWKYGKELYKRRNEVEQMFRRLKAFRRIATRYDKRDLMFSPFICLALCVIIGC
jgi:transposase